MGCFQARYDSRVVLSEHKLFIRLARYVAQLLKYTTCFRVALYVIKLVLVIFRFLQK